MSKPIGQNVANCRSSFLFSMANSGPLRPSCLIFVWINLTLYIKDLWYPCVIQTPNIPRGLFRCILLHAPGCHHTLTAAHAQKACTTYVTLITTPRKCIRELGRSEGLLIAIQCKHHWHWALLQLECLSRATFVMLRLWFSQGLNK